MKPATGFMVGAALQILHVFSECATELGGYSPEIYDRGLFLSAAQGCSPFCCRQRLSCRD